MNDTVENPIASLLHEGIKTMILKFNEFLTNSAITSEICMVLELRHRLILIQDIKKRRSVKNKFEEIFKKYETIYNNSQTIEQAQKSPAITKEPKKVCMIDRYYS